MWKEIKKTKGREREIGRNPFYFHAFRTILFQLQIPYWNHVTHYPYQIYNSILNHLWCLTLFFSCSSSRCPSYEQDQSDVNSSNSNNKNITFHHHQQTATALIAHQMPTQLRQRQRIEKSTRNDTNTKKIEWAEGAELKKNKTTQQTWPILPMKSFALLQQQTTNCNAKLPWVRLAFVG